jgi:hypothetical protein
MEMIFQNEVDAPEFTWKLQHITNIYYEEALWN